MYFSVYKTHNAHQTRRFLSNWKAASQGCKLMLHYLKNNFILIHCVPVVRMNELDLITLPFEGVIWPVMRNTAKIILQFSKDWKKTACLISQPSCIHLTTICPSSHRHNLTYIFMNSKILSASFSSDMIISRCQRTDLSWKLLSFAERTIRVFR